MCDILRAAQHRQNFIQIPYAIDPDAAQLDRFAGRSLRKDATIQAQLLSQLGHRKGARDLPQATVQAEFAHDQVAVQIRQAGLLGSGNDAQGDGQIIAAALFVQVGRRQVDDNLFARHPEAFGMQGRYGAQETFLDSSVG